MKTIRIYSDESRHKNERFMLLSGVWVNEENVISALNEIKSLRHEYGYKSDDGKFRDFVGEIKWQKVSDKYYDLYKRIVDIFFDWISKDTVRYCCMLIDTHNKEIQKYNNLQKDGYFKLLYQLYYQNSKTPAIYKIFPDSISNETIKVNLPKLDEYLDRAFRKRFTSLVNPADTPPSKGYVNNITPINSKSSEFIQIIDVIMGAIGYLQNGLFRNPSAKKTKVRLMKYIFEKMTLSGAILISGKSYYVAKSTKFNIWMFKPNKKTPFGAF
jgi:hypothetical protein